MAHEPTGPLLVFGYLVAVALSLPTAAAVLRLARPLGVRRAAALVGLLAVALVAVVGVAVGVLAGPVAGGSAGEVGLFAVVLLWALPVLVGRAVVGRLVGLAGDAALGYAVAGLPVAMVASAVVFVAPGGFGRDDLTLLTGPALWVGGAAFLAIVLLGPGLAGAGLVRLARRWG